ncbi:MAG: 1,4-dihydroxy-2-naphthoate polyprenyltransferase [Cyclobacteriaceae bacterium]|jgi:1,4-dihydroxy-2-naphthoate octaprenyltransferase
MSSSPKFMAWMQAVRLRTLPLALASIAMGTFLAADEGLFNLSIFILAAITTIFLQILSNLANDYGDSLHGADNIIRKGPERSVQSGSISARSMKIAISITAILSLSSGTLLLLTAIENLNASFFIFLLLGIAAILAAMGYTMGKNPYGYVGLGDLFVLLFFGLLGVLGTCFLFSGYLNPYHILPALTSGLFATAVLNVNNIRDIESDNLAGKKSIPVRIGRQKAVIYHWLLLGVGFGLAVIYVIINYDSPFQFLFIISLPLFIKNGFDVKNKTTASELDPSLKKMAISSLIFTLLFGIGLLIK